MFVRFNFHAIGHLCCVQHSYFSTYRLQNPVAIVLILEWDLSILLYSYKTHISVEYTFACTIPIILVPSVGIESIAGIAIAAFLV